MSAPTEFGCDLCDKTWNRDEYPEIVVLRTSVACHLWTEHAIHSGTDESDDRLPMTDSEIAWVRAQRGKR